MADADPSAEVRCPYNPCHIMTRKRLSLHLMKCQDRTNDFKTCPFNARHRVLTSEMQHHLLHCTHRRVVEDGLKRQLVSAEMAPPEPINHVNRRDPHDDDDDGEEEESWEVEPRRNFAGVALPYPTANSPSSRSASSNQRRDSPSVAPPPPSHTSSNYPPDPSPPSPSSSGRNLDQSSSLHNHLRHPDDPPSPYSLPSLRRDHSSSPQNTSKYRRYTDQSAKAGFLSDPLGFEDLKGGSGGRGKSLPNPYSIFAPDRFGFTHPVVEDMRERGFYPSFANVGDNDFSVHQETFNAAGYGSNDVFRSERAAGHGADAPEALESRRPTADSDRNSPSKVEAVRTRWSSPRQPETDEPSSDPPPSSYEASCPQPRQNVTRGETRAPPRLLSQQPPPSPYRSFGRGQFGSDKQDRPKRAFGRGQPFDGECGSVGFGPASARGARGKGRGGVVIDVAAGGDSGVDFRRPESSNVSDCSTIIAGSGSEETSGANWENAGDEDSGTSSADSGSEWRVGNEDRCGSSPTQPKKKLTPYQRAIKENLAKLQI